jgi:hypothetical protein
MDFEHQIPDFLKRSAKPFGGELAFPFSEVKECIGWACSVEIAVLGVEAFLARGDKIECVQQSVYELKKQAFQGWAEFVRANNDLALEFVESYALGDDHVYILTTSSHREYDEALKRSAEIRLSKR